MENTPVSAVTVTANPLGLPENDPYNQLSPSLDDGSATKKEKEKKDQKNKQQRLLDIQKQNKNDKKMQEENNQRTIASQVLTSAIQGIKEKEANGNPVENIQDTKEMIGILVNGGMNIGDIVEGIATSEENKEEDENSTKNNSSATVNQQPPVTVIPRR